MGKCLFALVTACLAVSEASQLSGDGTCHEDSQYSAIYQRLLGIIGGGRVHDPLIDRVLQVMQEKEVAFGSMLEIGPGPCHIAQSLGEHFSHVTLVEPNSYFMEACSERLASLDMQMHATTFDDFECNAAGYDLIVLSHVMYHVASSRWSQFLDKALSCLAKGGLLAVSMIHDSGPYFKFLEDKFGNISKSSREVRHHMSERHLPYDSKVVALPLVYNTSQVAQDFEACFNAIYFLVAEDALERESYRAMTVHQSKAFEALIRAFVWSLHDAVYGGFALSNFHEYITVQLPDPTRTATSDYTS
eukprot:TRINITY_DN65959_c0_g1_i1.p1 TRINITY_DN65959_c0_g1~~TRINITY_DN65959_c0_g1_i1.p1  ORF type:complete len:303 (+),score=46.00 TRINITY_DN65959_c0_g1_i1:51-959(+)